MYLNKLVWCNTHVSILRRESLTEDNQFGFDGTIEKRVKNKSLSYTGVHAGWKPKNNK